MRKCVVIADDDPVIIHLVSARLGADYDVTGADDGEQALRTIRAMLPAMAILDMRMPRRDGLSVLRALKADTATSHIPVMMLTGERDTDTVMTVLDTGAADYMVKPFRPDRLLERVNRLTAASSSGIVTPI